LNELLKAYRSLRKTGCDCRLLVVGSGPQEREARRYVMTRRLGGVEFLGRVSDDEKAQLFKTADVYVAPATGRESFGIVLLEAMAAGAPIVASDIHGYKGVVRRGEQALLVPPRDRKALAAALPRVLARPTGTLNPPYGDPRLPDGARLPPAGGTGGAPASSPESRSCSTICSRQTHAAYASTRQNTTSPAKTSSGPTANSLTGGGT